MKQYSTLPKPFELKPHHKMGLRVTSRTYLFGLGLGVGLQWLQLENLKPPPIGYEIEKGDNDTDIRSGNEVQRRK